MRTRQRRLAVRAVTAAASAVSILMAGAAVAPSIASAQSPAAHAIPAGTVDWTEHRGNALHTGVSTETVLSSSTAFKLHWTVNTGAKSYGSPAVVFDPTLNESLVYVGNMLGEFNAYNAATGCSSGTTRSQDQGSLQGDRGLAGRRHGATTSSTSATATITSTRSTRPPAP